MAKKVYEESKIAAIGAKIREKTGGGKTYKTSEMPSGIDEVYEAGKKAEYDAFWDIYLNDPNCQYLFYSSRWNDENFYPNKDITLKGGATFAFSSNYISNLKQRLIDCGVKLDTSKVTSGNYMFCFCGYLTHLPTLSFIGLTENIGNTFNNNRKMVEIEKIILKEDGSMTFTNWFTNCLALTTIAFEGVIGQNIDFSACANLSHDSLMSIINALSDTAVGKTLKIGSTNLAKLTEAELNIAYDKGWTVI